MKNAWSLTAACAAILLLLFYLSSTGTKYQPYRPNLPMPHCKRMSRACPAMRRGNSHR